MMTSETRRNWRILLFWAMFALFVIARLAAGGPGGWPMY